MTPNLKEYLRSLFFRPGRALTDQVVRGGAWMSLLRVTDKSLHIARLTILARLLSPSDFGILGIALLSLTAIKQLSNLGINSALVQREEANVDPFLNTAWLLKGIRGIGIFALLYVTAPTIALTFAEPRATAVLRVLGLGAIIQGLVNPSVVYFRKNLDFRKQYSFQVSGTVVDLIVAVSAALILQNVWALVFGSLAGRLTRFLASYLLSDYRPRIQFDRELALDVLNFGKWVWASGIVIFLATNGDDAFVGWYLTAAALGLYQMAFRLANAPATEVTHVIASVVFPAYSKIQNDREAIRSAFVKTFRVTAAIAIPMAGGIILVAPAFTVTVLGDQWAPMILAMQITALAGFIRAIVATGGALFKGVGEPDWDFRMNVVRASIIFATIYPLTDAYGISGAAASITLGIAGALPVWYYKTREITGSSHVEYLSSLLIPALGTALMAIPVRFVLAPTGLRLSLAIVLGMSIYAVYMIVVSKLVANNPLDDVRSLAS